MAFINLPSLLLICLYPIAAFAWLTPTPGSSSSSTRSILRQHHPAFRWHRVIVGTVPLYESSEHQSDEPTGSSSSEDEENETDAKPSSRKRKRVMYDLGLGKYDRFGDITQNWRPPEPVKKPTKNKKTSTINKNTNDDDIIESPLPPKVVQKSSLSKPVIKPTSGKTTTTKTTRRMIAKDKKSEKLHAALWDEKHYNSAAAGGTAASSSPSRSRSSSSTNLKDTASVNGDNSNVNDDSTKHLSYSDNNNTSSSITPNANNNMNNVMIPTTSLDTASVVKRPTKFYPDIDLSIPESVYTDDGSVDLVWDLLRWEAYEQAAREPLLVSFLHSTILHHSSLESSLAFLLANRLQSPAMMVSTQLQSMIVDSLADDTVFRRSLRADIMAVRDRDPACNYLPDVFLYFKGFHALQTHRVANRLWQDGKNVLAKYLQSQVSQIFQIDIHPNATLGSGIMLDHGTGIVIGETATVGHNCSILHHVTLGGSGVSGVLRHPQVGNGVLLGAGATVLGPVTIGDGTQVGAGTLVISDLPAHCVAVGVPARIIGSFVDVTEQPSIGMDQMMDDAQKIITFETEGI